MFKEENRIYWYLAGIIVFIVLLIFVAKDIVIPFINGRPTAITPGTFDYSRPPALVINRRSDYQAVIDTNYGTIRVDLFEKSAPNNVNNFVFLSNQGYYNGTKFHRLIPDLLLQGGDRNTLNDDPSDDGRGNVGYFIADEVNWDSLKLSQDQRNLLRNQGYKSTPNLQSRRLSRFVLAMASPRPNSNSNHFFFLLADNTDPRVSRMQGKYTVIGRVIAGGTVLQEIEKIAVDDPASNVPRPQTDIVLRRVNILTL